MGCEELIGSLRRSADEKIRLIWSEAEDEAGTLIEELNEKRSALREEHGKTQSTASAAEADQILAAANARARMIRLSSQKALSDRLFLLMTSCLPFLRKKGYEDIFADMAREFPPLPWHRVRVNPGDVPLAKEYFRGAEVVADEQIVGGADAEMEEGRIMVINTLQKRLERAWCDILPGLIKDVLAMVPDEETPAEP